MPSSTTSSFWRVGAKPADLKALGRSLASCAETFSVAVRRCAQSPRVPLTNARRLVDRTSDLERNVDRVAGDLDAADLAGRLTTYSTLLRRSLGGRGLLHPSRQARLLATDGGRQFLRVDAKDHGAVVEVVGDLSRAKHVAVLVPGMTNLLANYDPNTRMKGKDLANAMRAYDPNVAVVIWLGYRTPDGDPQGLLDGAKSRRARDGAKDLVDDLELVRRMAPRAHVSLVGHSYGSVVIGETLLSGSMRKRVDALDVDDIAVVGSPGMNTSSRGDLGHKDIDLWAGAVKGAPPKKSFTDYLDPWAFLGFPPGLMPQFPRDPVAYAPFHGEDPSAVGYGAKRFSTSGATNHSTYFSPGTLSLDNLARIATNTDVLTKGEFERAKKKSRK
jgi:Alpha/beta hydrolase